MASPAATETVRFVFWKYPGTAIAPPEAEVSFHLSFAAPTMRLIAGMSDLLHRSLGETVEVEIVQAARI